MENSVSHVVMPDFFLEAFSKEVTADALSDYLPNKVKPQKYQTEFLLVEVLVNSAASYLCEGYNGGHWHFGDVKSNEDAVFMYLDDDAPYKAKTCFSHRMVDGRIFGLVSCLMAFSNAAGYHFNKKNAALNELYANLYHGLRSAFYQTVDTIAYNDDSTATEDQKNQVREMAGAVYNILD